MPNPKLRLYFREPTVDTNMPITDGNVKVVGFEVEIVKREDDADAWDCGFAARVRAHAKGLAHASIPAFPNRKFRLSYIYVNSKAGIESPRDLEGKRVGIPQWDNTAGVWARGALQNYYKIDLTRINWLSVRSKMMSPVPRDSDRVFTTGERPGLAVAGRGIGRGHRAGRAAVNNAERSASAPPVP